MAAGLLRPLSGDDPEVGAGLGQRGSAPRSSVLGVNGFYPYYADAYRRAAAERGIQPRQMQSVTWEAIRGLFPSTWKTARNKAIVNDLWNGYRAGRLNLEEVRNGITQLISPAGSSHPTGINHLNDDISKTLRKLGIPVTRQSWINLAWPDGPPHPSTHEHEMELPEALQRK